MNCPVCDRSLAPTLSICPACGAMMNDSVREELQSKISQRLTSRPEPQIASPAARASLPPRPAMITPPVKAKPQPTADLVASKTSPTLVGFQNKNTSVPDWRLQIQNAVQQRRSGTNASTDGNRLYPTNGGAALKSEPVKVAEPTPDIADRRVTNAMRRIEESRKTFREPDAAAKKTLSARAEQSRPFGLVAPNSNSPLQFSPATTTVAVKPKLVAPPLAPVLERRDTNKLPPIETAIPAVIERVVPIEDTASVSVSGSLHGSEFGEIKRISIKSDHEPIMDDNLGLGFEDEIEDLAPFSMRFGAGLFDLIIGTFASMLILSPIAFSRSDWFTTSGMLVFAGTCAVVLFVYMTTCLGFFGKTMGMRLFSLELVDAVENEYPTLHQAAVSSSVFLVSMLFAGSGFLTMFFNEEKRAAHDLLSGTILVKEF